MSTLQRYAAEGRVGAECDAELAPDPNGPAVLFADVEEALADRDRLEWLMPVISGAPTDRVGDLRTQALAAGLLLGKTGRDLIDFAREGCPA